MPTGIRYLADLPDPARDAFQDTFEETRRRTDMEIGTDRVRRRRTTAPRLFSVVFMFNMKQYLEFDSWYQNDIKGGASPFDIQLTDDFDGRTWFTCYGKGEPTHEVVGKSLDQWKVTWTLRSVVASFTDRPSGTNELGGSSRVGIAGTGTLSVLKSFYGKATLGITAQGQLGAEGFYGKATLGITGTGEIYVPFPMAGVAHLGISGTGTFKHGWSDTDTWDDAATWNDNG